MADILIFKCTVPRRRASGIIALGGGGEKNIFLTITQTAPRPLSSFDTHARWQPVTQSIRSRRSYGKIEDREQWAGVSRYPLLGWDEADSFNLRGGIIRAIYTRKKKMRPQ